MRDFLLVIFGGAALVIASWLALDHISSELGDSEITSSQYKRIREAAKQHPEYHSKVKDTPQLATGRN